MNKKFCAVIPAAGKGERLGSPKILGKIGTDFFSDKICNSLIEAGIENISIVTFAGCNLDLFRFRNNVNWIINPAPEKGMLSSVYYGVRENMNCDGFLIVPVDHPLIKSSTFEKMKKEFINSPGEVLKVRYDNKAGHPVLIPHSLAVKIENKDRPGGLNKLIELNNNGIKYIDVEDPGTVQNINTTEDYKNFVMQKGNSDG